MPRDWGRLVGVRPGKLTEILLREGYSYSDLPEKLAEYGLNRAAIDLLLELHSVEREYFSEYSVEDSAIYIHIPFCPSRCLYCSFVSIANFHSDNLLSEYLIALGKEIRHLVELIQKSKLVPRMLYIGGGTPAILSSTELGILLKELAVFTGRIDEYTFEAGRPELLDEEKLQVLADYGVDRICINPQSMQNRTLIEVKRGHTAEDVFRAYDMARRYNFKINMDLIVGLAEETEDDVLDSLRQVIELFPEEITIHALALKRAAEMEQLSTSLNREIFPKLEEMLRSAGYRPYYLYRQRDSIFGEANIGYTRTEPCLYNMAMINERLNVLAAGAGANSKLSAGKENFERFTTPKDVIRYIRELDEIFNRKNRWWHNEQN